MVLYLPLNVRKMFVLLPLLSGCSLSSEIWSNSPSAEPTQTVREAPDFVSGEKVVTTAGTPGFEVSAALGEVESGTLSQDGGWTVEGVFHDHE